MSQIPHACNLVRTITEWWQAGTLLRGGRLEGRTEFSGKDYTGETQNTIENGHQFGGKAAGAGLVDGNPSAKLNRFSI
jgi:hypothetical protein